MTGRSFRRTPGALLASILLIWAGLALAGCSSDSGADKAAAPAQAPGSGTKGATPVAAPTGEGAKVLSDQQKAMEIEKGDGGQAPR